MVKFIGILLAGLLLGALAWWGLGTDSYLLVRVGDWAFQVTLWTALAALVLLWVLLAALRFVGTGFGFFSWQRRRRQALERKHLSDAFRTWFEGDWKRAAKGFLKAAERRSDPAPFLLCAASAAGWAGDTERALRILGNLEQRFPDTAAACAVVRTRLLNDAGRTEEGLTELKRLRERGVRTPEVELLEAELASAGDDMERLGRALKSLGRQPGRRATMAHLERHYYLRLLGQEGMETKALQQLMEDMPATALADDEIVRRVVERLGDLPVDAAVATLGKLIERHWHPQLVRAFGDIETSQTRKQLKRAERWLDKHLSAELLETLQKLAWRLSDSDRAHHYAQQLRVLRSAERD